MAFCPNCGAEAQGKFCAKCGAPLGGDTGPTATPTPVYVSPAQGGLTENLANALCYALGILTGILFLVLEPYNKNRTTRFHAFQAIFFWVAVVVAYIVAAIISSLLIAIPFLGAMISLLLHAVVGLGALVVWLLLMWKAYNNQRWVLPIIGPLAEKQV